MFLPPAGLGEPPQDGVWHLLLPPDGRLHADQQDGRHHQSLGAKVCLRPQQAPPVRTHSGQDVTHHRSLLQRGEIIDVLLKNFH